MKCGKRFLCYDEAMDEFFFDFTDSDFDDCENDYDKSCKILGFEVVNDNTEYEPSEVIEYDRKKYKDENATDMLAMFNRNKDVKRKVYFLLVDNGKNSEIREISLFLDDVLKTEFINPGEVSRIIEAEMSFDDFLCRYIPDELIEKLKSNNYYDGNFECLEIFEDIDVIWNKGKYFIFDDEIAKIKDDSENMDVFED